MLAHVIVNAKGVVTMFICKIHRTDSEDKRLMSHEFYEKNCPEGAIPQGPHHELEIIDPKLSEHPHADKLHFHHDQRLAMNFVYWTGRLPTTDDALTLFRTWSIGTAYTMATGEDFLPLVTNPEAFAQLMRDHHAVYTTGSGTRP